MTPIAPKPGFDWTKVRWSGPLAPVDDTCSYCGAAIPEHHVPLRLWSKESHLAAVFCHACMAAWWGIETFPDDDPNDDDDEAGIDDDDDFEEDDEPPEDVDHGPCCVCEGLSGVRNVLMLHKKAPMAGRGWGCVVCGLTCDGAIAIVCDTCIDQPLKFACRGYPATDGRVAIDELTGTHVHDLTRHSEEDER